MSKVLHELICERGPDSGKRFALTATEHFVGRDAACDIHLSDEFVSRKHCRFAAEGDGWSAQNLSSSGTIVNGVAKDRVALAVGDLIEIGPYTRLRFARVGAGTGAGASGKSPTKPAAKPAGKPAGSAVGDPVATGAAVTAGKPAIPTVSLPPGVGSVSLPPGVSPISAAPTMPMTIPTVGLPPGVPVVAVPGSQAGSAIAAPVNLPQVTIPQVGLPQVTVPAGPVPAVTMPMVGLPAGLPQVSLGGPPVVAGVPGFAAGATMPTLAATPVPPVQAVVPAMAAPPPGLPSVSLAPPPGLPSVSLAPPPPPPPPAVTPAAPAAALPPSGADSDREQARAAGGGRRTKLLVGLIGYGVVLVVLFLALASLRRNRGAPPPEYLSTSQIGQSLRDAEVPLPATREEADEWRRRALRNFNTSARRVDDLYTIFAWLQGCEKAGHNLTTEEGVAREKAHGELTDIIFRQYNNAYISDMAGQTDLALRQYEELRKMIPNHRIDVYQKAVRRERVLSGRR